MIPALERLVVGISVQTIHNRPKLPPIDRFKEPSKIASAKSHARPSVSRQPKKSRFASAPPGMHRDIVNHSSDSPIQKGRGYEPPSLTRPLSALKTSVNSNGGRNVQGPVLTARPRRAGDRRIARHRQDDRGGLSRPRR